MSVTTKMPERHLFQAVIRQMITDAVGAQQPLNTTKRTANKIRRDALAWFRNQGEDYYQCCEYAGVDAQKLRLKVLEFAEHGVQIDVKASGKNEGAKLKLICTVDRETFPLEVMV